MRKKRIKRTPPPPSLPCSCSQAIAALTKKGLVRDADFLDPIAADKPAGCWTMSTNPSASCSLLRSLAWPGYFFFHEVLTTVVL